MAPKRVEPEYYKTLDGNEELSSYELILMLKSLYYFLKSFKSTETWLSIQKLYRGAQRYGKLTIKGRVKVVRVVGDILAYFADGVEIEGDVRKGTSLKKYIFSRFNPLVELANQVDEASFISQVIEMYRRARSTS